MRELKKMRQDGLIAMEGRQVTLLEPVAEENWVRQGNSR